MNRSHCHDVAGPLRSVWNVLVHRIPFLLLLLVPCSLLEAGEYHSYRNGTLFCDECHQVATLDDIYPDDSLPPVTLREMSNDLCTSCHDNDPNASDVVGINKGRSSWIIREAGALNSVNARYPYGEGTGHTLGSKAPAPGSRPMWYAEGGLKCIDCHDPHGENPNGNAYRNLTASPGNQRSPVLIVTYSVGINDPSRDVFIRSGTDYDVSNVDFNEPISSYSAIGEFCKGCHTDFHGSKGDREVGGATGDSWVRHPSSEADIGWLGGQHSSKHVFAGEWAPKENFVKVMTSTNNWSPQTIQEISDHSPTCITCHKAHGNRNPFGLIFMGNTGQLSEEGTAGGTYSDLCRQCHVQSVSAEQFTRR